MNVKFKAADIQLTVENDMGAVAYSYEAKELKVELDTTALAEVISELLRSARNIKREVQQ